MEREIGDAGELLNNSVATRAVNIEPDMSRVARFDSYHRRYRNLLLGIGLAGLGLLGLGIGLWRIHHQLWGSVALLPALLLLWFASRLPQTLRGDAYRNGLLIPGIVSSLEPLTVTCLANVRADGEDDIPVGQPYWGVRQVAAPQLPLHAARLGEQVPCVSLFGPVSQDERVYTLFEPRPLSWGTANEQAIAQARAAIDDEEWAMLPRLVAAFAGAEKSSDDIAYFDPALNPVPPPDAAEKPRGSL